MPGRSTSSAAWSRLGRRAARSRRGNWSGGWAVFPANDLAAHILAIAGDIVVQVCLAQDARLAAGDDILMHFGDALRGQERYHPVLAPAGRDNGDGVQQVLGRFWIQVGRRVLRRPDL